MGKRSSFEKRARDYYPTPLEAVTPLAPHLPEIYNFWEPCAGDGRLVLHLKHIGGTVAGATDVAFPEDDPLQYPVGLKDAFDLTEYDMVDVDYIITNPPWSRDKKSDYILHKMIEHFANLRPTWLLFDADWAHTLQARPYLERYCTDIVSVGRVSWEQNGTSGKDNCAWYKFTKEKTERHVDFWARGVIPSVI